MNIKTTNDDGSNRLIGRMDALDYIDKTRAYLDYVEEHIKNVHKAFCEIYDACSGKWYIGDDASYFKLRDDIQSHDVSKLSLEEFTQYRQKFYPVENESVVVGAFEAAWENHKSLNTHHHESLKTDIDVVHMVIDWTAMGYKFGDTAESYYEANKERIDLSNAQKEIMFEVFSCIKAHRASLAKEFL